MNLIELIDNVVLAVLFITIIICITIVVVEKIRRK